MTAAGRRSPQDWEPQDVMKCRLFAWFVQAAARVQSQSATLQRLWACAPKCANHAQSLQTPLTTRTRHACSAQERRRESSRHRPPAQSAIRRRARAGSSRISPARTADPIFPGEFRSRSARGASPLAARRATGRSSSAVSRQGPAALALAAERKTRDVRRKAPAPAHRPAFAHCACP